MASWPTKPLGGVCDLINGRAFKPSEWMSEGLPIIRIQNLNNHGKPFNMFDGKYQEKHFISDGAILLSWSGTPGTSFGCFRWFRGPALLNQHIFKVVVDEDIMDGEFFIHAVNSRLHEMIRQAHGGVGLRHITKSKLEAIQLPVPEIDEQRRIVARLKECMERIDEIEGLRVEVLVEAEHLAPSLYAAIEDSKSWPRRTVSEVITKSRNGRSIRQDNENGNGFVLSLRAVHDISLDISQRKPIVLPDATRKQYSITSGDVFVSRSNTRDLVGLSSVATGTPEDSVIYPDLLIKLESKPDIILPRFLAYALRTPDSRRQIKERAVGTSQSMVKISGQRLKDVEIPVPPLKQQAKLIDRFDELHDLSAQLKSELRSLNPSTIRQSILHKAFSGEL